MNLMLKLLHCQLENIGPAGPILIHFLPNNIARDAVTNIAITANQTTTPKNIPKRQKHQLGS